MDCRSTRRFCWPFFGFAGEKRPLQLLENTGKSSGLGRFGRFGPFLYIGMAPGWLSMRCGRHFSVVDGAGWFYASKMGQMGQTDQNRLDFTGESGLDAGRFPFLGPKNGQ
jgi:hypothetical protein